MTEPIEVRGLTARELAHEIAGMTAHLKSMGEITTELSVDDAEILIHRLENSATALFSTARARNAAVEAVAELLARDVLGPVLEDAIANYLAVPLPCPGCKALPLIGEVVSGVGESHRWVAQCETLDCAFAEQESGPGMQKDQGRVIAAWNLLVAIVESEQCSPS